MPVLSTLSTRWVSARGVKRTGNWHLQKGLLRCFHLVVPKTLLALCTCLSTCMLSCSISLPCWANQLKGLLKTGLHLSNCCMLGRLLFLCSHVTTDHHVPPHILGVYSACTRQLKGTLTIPSLLSCFMVNHRVAHISGCSHG